MLRLQPRVEILTARHPDGLIMAPSVITLCGIHPPPSWISAPDSITQPRNFQIAWSSLSNPPEAILANV
jgi:hypothetical protein